MRNFFLNMAMAKSYTDSQRLAYEETKVTKMADFVVPAGQGSYDGSEMVIDAPFAIEVGQLYFVTINGKTFETYGGEDNRGRYIKIVENDAPVFEAYFEAPRFSVLAVDPNGQGSDVDRCVVIETRQTVIHGIDPKYFPAGGVGYEEARPKLADFVMPAGKGGSSSAYIKAPFLFSEGDNREKTYSITVNGKTYELTGKMGETFAIGDYNLENEPHLYIEEYADYGLWNVYVYDPNGLTDMVDRHIVIETGEVTIHTIESKYLPVGGVGYEEPGEVLVNCIPTGGTQFSKAPFIPKVGKTYSITTDRGTKNAECEQDETGYMIFADNGNYVAAKDGSYWQAVDYNKGNTFILREETIVHTIEPKFLPAGGVGYDNSKVITWDGDITGKHQIGGNFCKVMDDMLDLESITRVVWSVNDGSTLEFTDFKIDRNEEISGLLYLVPMAGGPRLVLISDGSYSPDIPKGTYLVVTSLVWTSRVEYTDIKTIEPKFLPVGGVGSAKTAVRSLLDTTMTVGQYNGNTIDMPHRLEVGAIYKVRVNDIVYNIRCATEDGRPTLNNYYVEICDYGIEHDNLTGNDVWTVTVYGTNAMPNGTKCRVTVEGNATIVHVTETPTFSSACLPMVNAVNVVNEQHFDKTTALFLKAAADSEMPIIVKYKDEEGYYYSGVANYCWTPSGYACFEINHRKHVIYITEQDSGAWVFGINKQA